MKKNPAIQILERRYGNIEKDVRERFGKEFFNGIKGWQFPEEEIRKANNKGRLLTMDLDLPGDICRLNCVYCFAKAGEKTGTYYRPGKGDKSLTMEEVKKYLIEAKKLGLKSVKIIGYREPFENKEIFNFINFAAQQKIHLVIFTALYTLGEDKFQGNIKKTIDFLAKKSVSLMVKLHTLDRKREDQIVQLKGYSQTRDKYLKLLLADGRFTNQSPTRLGLENVISSQDIDELSEIYKYFKIYRNVFVDLDPPIPVGRTGTLAEAEKAGLPPQRRLKELCIKTYRINQQYKIPFRGVSSYFGGYPCTQLPNGIYITLSGKVMTCCGGNEEIGNVRKNSIKEILRKNPYWKKKNVFHNCPYREKREIMTAKFIKEAEEELIKT